MAGQTWSVANWYAAANGQFTTDSPQRNATVITPPRPESILRERLGVTVFCILALPRVTLGLTAEVNWRRYGASWSIGCGGNTRRTHRQRGKIIGGCKPDNRRLANGYLAAQLQDQHRAGSGGGHGGRPRWWRWCSVHTLRLISITHRTPPQHLHHCGYCAPRDGLVTRPLRAKWR